MKLDTDIAAVASGYDRIREGKVSRHSAEQRLEPSKWQYDWMLLRALASDVQELVSHARSGGVALDIGSGNCPYAPVLRRAGYSVRTLDVMPGAGVDHVGTVEDTGLPAASVDLVICTQVLEHCLDPWAATREIARILRPGGMAIVSAPHVWFYHPHPSDNWRFTQEGLIRLAQHGGLRVREMRAQGGSAMAFGQILNFLVYGVLGTRAALLYRLVNAMVPAVDRLMPNPLFSLNYACLAELPMASEPAGGVSS